MQRAVRSMSFSSRLWVASHNTWPSFSIHLFLEGSGVLDVPRWREAVADASAASTGARMVLKGHVRWSRWEDSGITPPVRVFDAEEWKRFGSEGSDVINNYSPRRGPMAEVILIQGDTPRVVIRSHHALMDGRGTLTWTEDIFRALRGEPVLASDEGIVEADLLNLSMEKPVNPGTDRFIAPTGRAQGFERGLAWRSKTVVGRFPKLPAQIALLAAREAWRHGEGRVRFGIPVDLRPRRPGIKSSGNLTNALFVEVTPDMDVNDIADQIARKVDERRDGYATLEDTLIHYMPMSLIEKVLRKEASRSLRSGLYRYSGFISNLGLIRKDAYRGGGFTTRTMRLPPVCLESFPFSMCTIGFGDEVALFLAMPKVLANNGRIEDILTRIADGLVCSSA